MAGKTSRMREGFKTDFFNPFTKGEESDSLEFECTNVRRKKTGEILENSGASHKGLSFQPGAMRSIRIEILSQVDFRTVKTLENTTSPSSNDANLLSGL